MDPAQTIAGEQTSGDSTLRTAPDQALAGMPPGIPYIIGNEAAERFSFYGMRTILVVFMTQYLMNRAGQRDVMAEVDANINYHYFLSGVYAFPLLGAVVADRWWGKYRTVFYLSIIYCFGHLALALDDTRLGLYLGLALIALGAGGIKPCVTAMVGDQFGRANQSLMTTVFLWFYFAINFGAFFSSLLTPWLLEHFGTAVAFGFPGVLMLVSTIILFLGRKKFVHVPPAGGTLLREVFSREGARVLLPLIGLYIFVAVFFALYDQSGGEWVLQAGRLDLRFLGFTLLPSQVQSINPLLILFFIPLFSYVVYPAMNRLFRVTPLRKIGIGLILTAIAFCIPAWIEMRLAAGATVGVAWQLFAYAVLTAAEVMVYGTGLEFAYTQAPNKMKSIVMSLFLLAISLGNASVSILNWLIRNPDGTTKLAGPNYYFFFVGLMAFTALIYVFYAMRFRERSFLQDAAV
jgi:POT family proton-dependent oligopeptide transporter